jgi:hypothetical protein
MAKNVVFVFILDDPTRIKMPLEFRLVFPSESRLQCGLDILRDILSEEKLIVSKIDKKFEETGDNVDGTD